MTREQVEELKKEIIYRAPFDTYVEMDGIWLSRPIQKITAEMLPWIISRIESKNIKLILYQSDHKPKIEEITYFSSLNFLEEVWRNHLDCSGLIEAGLAVDAKSLGNNPYIKE
jgi:hypothetical protein